MNTNSENPKIGRIFQERVKVVAEEHFGIRFIDEKAVLIGHPSKEHRFDFVS